MQTVSTNTKECISYNSQTDTKVQQNAFENDPLNVQFAEMETVFYSAGSFNKFFTAVEE